MSMSDRDGFIWLDGDLIPWREAKVHVLNLENLNLLTLYVAFLLYCMFIMLQKKFLGQILL